MRRALRIVALALLVLLAVVVTRTLRFRSRQVVVDAVPPASLDGQALAARLAQALRFRTVSHQDAADVDGAAFLALHRYLEERFPHAHRELKRETVGDYSLLYTWEGTEPARAAVLLLSHTDVVPVEPGTEAEWIHPPFAGQVADGYVWGRGALDAKFGVLGILEAVEQLLQAGFRPRATILLAFGHDEEVGGTNGARQIAALLEARGVRPAYVLDEGGAVTEGVVPGVAAPVALVGVAEKGSVSLELTVRAEGGHSSAPPPHTAVGMLSAAVRDVERAQMPAALRVAAGRFFEYVGPEMPLAQRLVFANLWLFGGLVERQLAGSPATNAMLRTTTAATMIEGGVKENVLPTSARAVVNFRILPGNSVQDVIDHVNRAVRRVRAAGAGIEIRPLDPAMEPSPEAPTDGASFVLLQRTIREVFPGTVVAPYLTIGGTDARHYTGLTGNVYRFAPLIADASALKRVHGSNERVAVEDYLRGVRFFMQLIKNSA